FSRGPLDLTRAALIEPGATAYSVSNEGTVVVQTQALQSSTLEWIGPDGQVTQAAGAPIRDLWPWVGLSADGTRVAYVAQHTQPTLYVRDLTTGADTRVAAAGDAAGRVPGSLLTLTNPAWFPAGDRLLYVRETVQDFELMAQDVTGSGVPSVLAKSRFGRVTPDGRHLIWTEFDRGEGRLRYAPLSADGTPGEARNGFPGSERLNVRWFDVSPDGALLAYVATDANLQSNIHLVSFPGGHSRWQVTTEGGTFVQFASDGRALYYFAGGRSASGAPEPRMMTMRLDPGPPVRLGAPTVRFAGADVPAGFAVARDGRLLVVRRIPPADGEESRAILVQNWPSLVHERR
ncbi:MAG TPA: hypothetical protein VIL25_06505, partial [Vicinamibacterales bacterium]